MAQEEFSNNMNRLYLVDQALPEKPDFPLLIFAVEKEAQETDTQIQSLSVTKISVKAGEEVQPKAAPVSFFDFNLILTGDYQNLKGFLGRMENLRRIVKLDSISFEKAKKTEKELPKIKLSVTGRANFHPQEISL
jgi:Tfp pilus assembly protein PilO